MRILVKGANWIGDAVMSIPAVRQIRAAFPGSFIALHTRKWAEGVFGDTDLFDQIISFDPAGSKMRSVIDQSNELRKHSFDAVVLLPNSFESALTVAMAGIPRRFGYRTDGRRTFLTDSIPVPDWKSQRHESEFYSNLAEFMIQAMGGSKSEVSSSRLLAVSEEGKRLAREQLRSNGISLDRPIVAVGAGSTNSMAKRWPTEYFAQLSDSLVSELGAQIVLLGSLQELDVGTKLASLCRASVYDITGKTDLFSAKAILGTVDLFVSNDMGLAHIAAALGTATLTIFGPTNESATAPLGPNARFVREVVECSPCMLRECPIDHRCMRLMSPDRVLRIVVEMLKDRRESND